MTREQAAVEAMGKVAEVLDDCYRGNQTLASAFFEITQVRAEYEAQS
ncbi:MULTISPECIES: hypothetical protein [Arthrobacter]|nr:MULTISPECIES: hypothetical protein [Arthrobacter]MBT8161023.1 hypothetical protein [Arthrobacter sp. GN70]